MFFIDPVCLKKLRKKQEYAILKNQNKIYHFCCLACKLLFIKQPDQFLNKDRLPLKL